MVRGELNLAMSRELQACFAQPVISLWHIFRYCVQHKMYDVMGLLMESGIDVNRRDEHQMTEVMVAVASAMEAAFVQEFHTSDSDIMGSQDEPTAPTMRSKLPTDLNTRLDYALTFLKASPDLERRDSQAETVLLHLLNRCAKVATKFKSRIESASIVTSVAETFLRALIDAGANVNVRSAKGETPLMLAARLGDATMVQRLLDAYADPEATAHNGYTALMVACVAGRVAAAQALLASATHAVINAKDKLKTTALMYAVKGKHEDTVKLLLEKKRGLIDLDAKMEDGRTALLLAAEQCGVATEVVAVTEPSIVPLPQKKQPRPRRMVAAYFHGLDMEETPELPDIPGLPPGLASPPSHPVYPPLAAPTPKSDADKSTAICLLLLDATPTPDLTAVGPDGQTALHIAAARGNAPVVIKLLKLGAGLFCLVIFGGMGCELSNCFP
jgi:ankyrin repeat protein